MHLSHWGQMRLSALIARAVLPGRELDAARLDELARRLWRPLGAHDPSEAAAMAAFAVEP